MKKLTYLIAILFALTILFSCNTAPTNNDEKPKCRIYQIPGCGNHTLAKSALFPEDSCFVYQFDSKLIIEFCLTANCCPDSDRFEFDYEINKDSIFVTVEDTAGNLCYCICPYTIHMEINNPQENHYYFYCDYYDKIIYTEEIYKKKLIK